MNDLKKISRILTHHSGRMVRIKTRYFRFSQSQISVTYGSNGQLLDFFLVE